MGLASPDGNPTLYYLNYTVSIISLFGSLVLIRSCYKEQNKTTTLKLISGIALSDFILSFTNIMSQFEYDKMDAFCQTEATLRIFALNFGLCMTTSISIFCYRAFKEGSEFNQTKFLKYVVIFSVSCGLILSFLPYFTNKAVYTNGRLMCMITFKPGLDLTERLFIDMISSGFSIILGIIITATTYLRTVVNVKKLAAVHYQKINSGIHKLLWYPAALFIVFFPGLIDRFMYIIDQTHKPPLTFLILHVTFNHSIGTINAIIYGIQKKKSEYKRSETIVSLNGGSKQVDMTNLSSASASSHQGETKLRNDSYVL